MKFSSSENKKNQAVLVPISQNKPKETDYICIVKIVLQSYIRRSFDFSLHLCFEKSEQDYQIIYIIT